MRLDLSQTNKYPYLELNDESEMAENVSNEKIEDNEKLEKFAQLADETIIY